MIEIVIGIEETNVTVTVTMISLSTETIHEGETTTIEKMTDLTTKTKVETISWVTTTETQKGIEIKQQLETIDIITTTESQMIQGIIAKEARHLKEINIQISVMAVIGPGDRTIMGKILEDPAVMTIDMEAKEAEILTQAGKGQNCLRVT